MYEASGNSFNHCLECLSEGPTTASLVSLLNKRMEMSDIEKVRVDEDDVWHDMLAYYKSPSLDVTKQLRIKMQDSPVIDTGGLRRHVFSTVFNSFASNKHCVLFEGSSDRLSPVCTSLTRLFKVLGTMIGHSICMDGIGFPYLSPANYWYMVDGEETATQFASVNDIGSDIQIVVSKVWNL